MQPRTAAAYGQNQACLCVGGTGREKKLVVQTRCLQRGTQCSSRKLPFGSSVLLKGTSRHGNPGFSLPIIGTLECLHRRMRDSQSAWHFRGLTGLLLRNFERYYGYRVLCFIFPHSGMKLIKFLNFLTNLCTSGHGVHFMLSFLSHLSSTMEARN